MQGATSVGCHVSVWGVRGSPTAALTMSILYELGENSSRSSTGRSSGISRKWFRRRGTRNSTLPDLAYVMEMALPKGSRGVSLESPY